MSRTTTLGSATAADHTTPVPAGTPSTGTASDRPAVVPAHLSSKSDNWPTPQGFFDALDAEFGFVLDVCASTGNHKADDFYALDHPDDSRRDGLSTDWAGDAAQLGGAVWMNPPYGRPISSWMAKACDAARNGATVVTLVPVRADTAWWHEHVLATGAEVRYVRGRLTFGDAVNTATFASAVVIYRPSDAPGRPGPVTTMPARPAQPAPVRVPVAADVTSSAEAFDCIRCRWETGSTTEHGCGNASSCGAETLADASARPTTEAAMDRSHDAVSRLDQVTTHALTALYESVRCDPGMDAPTGMLAGNVSVDDSVACLALARVTIVEQGGMGRAYKQEAAVQHLFGTLWQYTQFFHPGAGWELAESNPAGALLLWRHHDLLIPDVVDVIAASGHPDLVALPRPSGSVVRVCNLTNRPASLLLLPQAADPVPWTASADPLRRLVLAA